MKIRKTRQDRRETYRYEAYLEKDNGEYTKECIELKPGTDGVCNAALYSRRKKHFIFDSINIITALSLR